MNPDKENRFAVFIGADYYPGGGWHDFKEAFPTLVEALAYVKANVDPTWGWGQVVDLHTLKDVTPL